MPEWLNGTVSKTVDPSGSLGSNPSLSAGLKNLSKLDLNNVVSSSTVAECKSVNSGVNHIADLCSTRL